MNEPVRTAALRAPAALALALLAAAPLAAQGGSEGAPERGASTDGPSFDERVAALMERRDVAQDDWPSERLAEAAGAQLRRLGDLAARDASLAEAGLERLFHPDFSCVELRPAGGSEERRGALVVRRLGPDDYADAARERREDPRRALAELLAPFAQASDLRIAWQVVDLQRRSAGRFEAEVLYSARARLGEGAVQQDARWDTTWAPPGEGDRPLLLELRPRALTEVRAERPLFREATGGALAAAGGRSALLAGGSDHWLNRIDDLGEPNVWGHNGIAVADVNGDGLDDLYVATGTGVPNLLFVQQPDGTALERGFEAGVAWMDDTKGVLLIDYDNDGDRDLFCAIGPALVISDNDGSGSFTPARQLAAGTNSSFYSLAAGDYDLDGDLDVYACRYVRADYGASVPVPYHDAVNGPRNHLLRNDGERGFSDATDAVGLGEGNDRFSLVATWTDYDRDGDPDLYVANDFGRNNLYRNDGGRFVDVAGEAGVEDQAAGMGISWADYDLDGDLDLYVSNMSVPAGRRIARQPEFHPGVSPEVRAELGFHAMGNSLLENLGGGRFEDVGMRAGVRAGGWSWGASFADFDGDTWPDVVVPNGFLSNTEEEDLSSFFWRQAASHSPTSDDPLEVERYLIGWAATTRLMDAGMSWSGNERNYGYLNMRDGTFVDVSGVAGLDFEDDARATATCDWDGDGAVDLWIKNRTSPALRFLHNTGGGQGHWVSLSLEGRECNRDAVGARVELGVGGRTLVRETYAGEGYLAQSSPWLTFGLGAAERVDSLKVIWPGGAVQELSPPAVDGRYRVVQGSEELRREPDRRVRLDEERAAWPEPPTSARIVLRTPLPLPPSLQRYFMGSSQEPRARLISLWASWCGPCIVELGEWAEHSDELSYAGLDVVPLAMDDEGMRELAERLFETRIAPRLKDPGFRSRAPSEEERRGLEVLLEHVIHDRGEGVLPTSVLVNKYDMVEIVYVGAVGFDQLLEDAASYGMKPEELTTRGAWPGRWYYGMPRDLEGLARACAERGDARAASFYRRLLARDPRRRR